MTRRDRDRLVADLTAERDAAAAEAERLRAEWGKMFDARAVALAERDEWRRLAEGGADLHRDIMARLRADVPDPEVTP